MEKKSTYILRAKCIFRFFDETTVMDVNNFRCNTLTISEPRVLYDFAQIW